MDTWSSTAMGLEVEVEMSVTVFNVGAARSASASVDSTTTQSQTKCNGQSKYTTREVNYPPISLPPKSVVQYTYTRREVYYQDAEAETWTTRGPPPHTVHRLH